MKKPSLETRNQKFAALIGGLLLVGLIAGAIFFATGGLDARPKSGPEPVPQSDVTTVPGDIAAPITPGTPESSTIPPTTIADRAYGPDGKLIIPAARPREAEPKQVTVRTPVRCPAGGTPTAGELPGDSANGPKKWVTVSEISGSCDLQGGQFALRGIDTRIVFRSDASNFNAFVVDSVTGVQGTAGYPHAQCSSPCSDADFITDPAGRYNLRVQADGGPWQLLIQEYR